MKNYFSGILIFLLLFSCQKEAVQSNIENSIPNFFESTQMEADYFSKQGHDLLRDYIESFNVSDDLTSTKLVEGFLEGKIKLNESEREEILSRESNIEEYIGVLYTTNVIPYYNELNSLIMKGGNLNELHFSLDLLKNRVSNELENNDKFLMLAAIETGKQATAFWYPVEKGGLGYHEKLRDKLLGIDNDFAIAQSRSSASSIAAGAVAGMTTAVNWLGASLAAGIATPGTNGAILGGIAAAGVGGALFAAANCYVNRGEN